MDGRGQENTLNLKGNDEDKLGSALALHYCVASAKNKSGFMLEETNFSGKIFFCFQIIPNLLVKKNSYYFPKYYRIEERLYYCYNKIVY